MPAAETLLHPSGMSSDGTTFMADTARHGWSGDERDEKRQFRPQAFRKGLHRKMREANGAQTSFGSEMEELYGTQDRSPKC